MFEHVRQYRVTMSSLSHLMLIRVTLQAVPITDQCKLTLLPKYVCLKTNNEGPEDTQHTQKKPPPGNHFEVFDFRIGRRSCWLCCCCCCLLLVVVLAVVLLKPNLNTRQGEMPSIASWWLLAVAAEGATSKSA